MNSLVSVIVPTYNRERVIENAVNTVLNQTYKNIEIIVVDDGSADNTRVKLAAYEKKIKYYYKSNGGCSCARNFGIDKANGQFIAFLDSDDEWLPNKIEKQLVALEQNEGFGLAICDIAYVDNNKQVVYCSKLRETIKADGEILEQVLLIPNITCSYMMVKKQVFDIVGKFDETFDTANDYEMMLRITSKFKTVLIEEPLVRYKKSDNSVSHKLFSKNRLRAIEKLARYNPEFFTNKRRLIKNARSLIHLSYADDLLWHRYLKKSRNEIINSLKNRITLKAIILFLKNFLIVIIGLLWSKYKDKES
jgi:Glycosyltransferases involved in cell wall biogenesis